LSRIVPGLLVIASCSLVSGAAVAQAASTGSGQGYPSKPIRLIVPFPPGGGTDIVARIIAQPVSERLGQTVVVDNRGGGSATVGTETAVRANPDGYTLVMVSGSYGATAALYKLPYDPVNGIQPIILVGELGLVVATHPAVPVKSVKELIAYAKGNPGKLNYGSTGTASLAHLSGELFKLEAKVDLTHVPYKGMGPALNDLIGGQIQLTFGSVVSTIPHLKSGRLRAIAVTTAKRSAALPDVAAVGETVPGYAAVNSYGILGPKGLSKNIVLRWNNEVARALQADEIKSRMAGQGLELAGGPPEQFLNLIRRDVETWKRVVKAAKITVAD